MLGGKAVSVSTRPGWWELVRLRNKTASWSWLQKGGSKQAFLFFFTSITQCSKDGKNVRKAKRWAFVDSFGSASQPSDEGRYREITQGVRFWKNSSPLLVWVQKLNQATHCIRALVFHRPSTNSEGRMVHFPVGGSGLSHSEAPRNPNTWQVTTSGKDQQTVGHGPNLNCPHFCQFASFHSSKWLKRKKKAKEYIVPCESFRKFNFQCQYSPSSSFVDSTFANLPGC
jgi:hypothetical protein